MARIRDHVASNARLGCTNCQHADVSATASLANAANGLSGFGAVPRPAHFLSTTEAMRAARLPRLFARSELYRETRPSYVKSPSLPYDVSLST